MSPERERLNRIASEAAYGPIADDVWKLMVEQFEKKKRARAILNRAIRRGIILRMGCEVCGKKAHGHHPDYANPLAVIWLCPSHHRKEHIRLSTLSDADRAVANRLAKEKARISIDMNIVGGMLRAFIGDEPWALDDFINSRTQSQ